MTEWTLGLFADHVGEGFTLVGAPEETVWTLTVAEPFGPSADPAKTRQFSLSFRGAPEPMYDQQLVRLHHPALGELDIFIVPVARDGGGVTYQAEFN